MTVQATIRQRQIQQAPWQRVLVRLRDNYFIRTLAKAIFTIWFVATLLFFLFRLLPSNPIDVYMQEAIVIRNMTVDQARAEATAIFEVDLDRPLPLQYLDFINQLAHGNLGKSLISKGTPVGSIIIQFLPYTIFTVGTGLAVSFILGISLGTIMAYKRESWIDHVLSTFAAFMHGIPQLIAGILMIVWLGVQLKLFSVSAVRGALSPGIEPALTWTFFSDALAHAWLPIAAYVLTTISHWMLLMKNATTASLEEDYVSVARARGLSDQRIASAYVGRNSILPLITYAAIAFGGALGGSAIIETLFVYRGLGQRLTEAINSRDYPVMQGIFLVLTAAVIFSNLFADILYSRIDPRIRVGGTNR